MTDDERGRVWQSEPITRVYAALERTAKRCGVFLSSGHLAVFAEEAIAAMRDHPKPEAAGLHDGKAVSGKLDDANLACRMGTLFAQLEQQAETERSQRESEGEAYRNEIEQLKEDLADMRGERDLARVSRDEARGESKRWATHSEQLTATYNAAVRRSVALRTTLENISRFHDEDFSRRAALKALDEIDTADGEQRISDAVEATKKIQDEMDGNALV